MDHILSFSYGKDSMASIEAIHRLGWKLDRIVHAEIMATSTLSANTPEMMNFKKYADKVIKERYGIEVEHYTADVTYEDVFYRKFGSMGRPSKKKGRIYGFPMTRGNWCLELLKLPAIKKANIGKDDIQYVGIAIDEPQRFKTLTDKKLSPLKEIGWTEADCRKWCEENDLLSPVYENFTRDGCWMCHNQGLDQLRRLYNNYPEYWALMMKWDSDSPVSFRTDGTTIHDYDKRFKAENLGLVPKDRKFRWKMLEELEQQN